MLREGFPNQDVQQVDPRHYLVKLQNGNDLHVHLVDKITGPAVEMQLAPGNVALGSFQKIDNVGIMQLAGISSEATLGHEIGHAGIGLLPKNLQDAVFEKFGGNEEKFCDWFGENRKTFNRGGTPDTLYGQIRNYFQDLYEKVFKPADFAMRRIHEGKVWGDNPNPPATALPDNSIAPKLSVQSWTPEAKDQIRAANDKLGIVPPEQLNRWMKNLDSVARSIVEDHPELQYEPSALYSSLKANADKLYKDSLDFSTICRKRAELQSTIGEIASQLWKTEKRGLTTQDLVDIRNDMRSDGRQVSCGACYVDSGRAKAYQDLSTFAEKYPKIGSDSFTPDGWDKIKESNPDIYKELRSRFGALGGKGFETRTDYRGELLQKFGGKTGQRQVQDYNSRSGLRWQSWSDFEVPHALDAIQATLDSSVVGLAGHAYTKVPEFVDLMGNTGLMINQSLMPPMEGTGIDINGNLLFDDTEGMPHDLAFKNRNKYPNTVGAELMGVNDDQITAALASKDIDYVIPYHRSGMSKELRGRMGSDWKDYQDVQNDRDYNSNKASKEEKAIWDRVRKDNDLKLGKYDPDHPKVEWSEHNGDFQKYIGLAAKRGLLPRFTQWLEDPNYMKLLTDKRMFDNAGNRIQQRPLAANFDMKRINKMLRDYVPTTQAPYKPTVDRFVNKQPAPKPPTQPLTQIQPYKSEPLPTLRELWGREEGERTTQRAGAKPLAPSAFSADRGPSSIVETGKQSGPYKTRSQKLAELREKTLRLKQAAMRKKNQ